VLVDATVKLREADGSLIQDLSAGGYWVSPVEEPGVIWRRDRVTSPFVDGWSLIAAAKDGAVLAFSVRVEGATWVEVEQRRQALVDWLDAWSYQVEVYADGVSNTYVAEPADITPEPLTASIVANKARQFAVAIPVQPNPAATGV
jgi:hypothetical protein